MKLDLISETKMPPGDDGACTTVSIYLPDADMSEFIEDLKYYQEHDVEAPDYIIEAMSVENYVLDQLGLNWKIPCEPIPGRAYHTYFVYPIHSYIAVSMCWHLMRKRQI